MSSSQEQVKELIFKHLAPSLEQRGIAAEEVSHDQNLVEIGVLDSISFLELLTNLEADTGVEIDFDNMDPSSFTSVDSLASFFSNS